MKDGKYSVMIVEDQQMPKALFSHFVESSDKFYLQAAIENASVADIVCTRMPVDLTTTDIRNVPRKIVRALRISLTKVRDIQRTITLTAVTSNAGLADT